MSYQQLIDLAIAAEENRRELWPVAWDEPALDTNEPVYIPGVTNE